MISFDNVIGVVAAAKGYFGFMIFGLMLSVVLTGALSNIYGQLYTKTYLDSLCRFSIYLNRWSSISNWWVS